MTFKNLLTFVTGQTTKDFDFSSEVNLNTDTLKGKIIQKITANFHQHPFIVFMAEDDSDFERQLYSVCKNLDGSFKAFNSDEEALRDKLQYSNAVKGVFVPKRDFGRGLDLKLGKDAEVLILGNNHTLTHSEAIQMVGRGSRS